VRLSDNTGSMLIHALFFKFYVRIVDSLAKAQLAHVCNHASGTLHDYMGEPGQWPHVRATKPFATKPFYVF
jgi:hypothetical protein